MNMSRTKYKCPKCEQQSTTPEAPKQHEQIKHSTHKYLCTDRDTQFKVDDKPTHHILIQHIGYTGDSRPDQLNSGDDETN